jgi:hypothetical protein
MDTELIDRLSEFAEHVARRGRGEWGFGGALASYSRGKWTVSAHVNWARHSVEHADFDRAVAELTAEIDRTYPDAETLAATLGVSHAAQ